MSIGRLDILKSGSVKVRKIDVTLDNGREETLVFEPPVDAEQLTRMSSWRYGQALCQRSRKPIAQLRPLCFNGPALAATEATMG